MADQMHANKAKYSGPGRYTSEIVAVYLGKTALEDTYMIIAADGHSGSFVLNDGTASGHFDCGDRAVTVISLGRTELKPPTDT